MKTVVWFSLAFAVLASGCAMGPEGPRDCSGTCDEASFELSSSDSMQLAGTWIAADGKKSMKLGENGYCELDGVPCIYTTRATAPAGEYTFPWFVDLEVGGKKQTFEVSFIDSEYLVAKDGEGFADYAKTGSAIVPERGTPLPPENTKPASFDKQQEPSPAYDAIQPYGRTPGNHH